MAIAQLKVAIDFIVSGLKKIQSASASLRNLAKSGRVMERELKTRFQTISYLSEELGKSYKEVERGLSGIGVAVSRTGRIYEIGTGRFVKMDKVVGRLKYSMRRFRMELLSVMFFGMALQRMFLGWLKPAMEAYGIFDMFNTMLLVMFIPIMETLAPILYGIMEWFMNLPEPIKKAIGILTLIGAVIGIVFAYFGILGLGIDGVIKTFGHLRTAGGLLKTKFGDIFKAIKDGFTRMVSFISAHPIILVIMAIIAAIIILNEMWKRNIWGIRQKWGSFLIWFSGVFDRWLKPVFMAIGTGVIVLVNSVILYITTLKNMWTMSWLAIKLVAFTVWNAILGGIKGLADGIIGFINVLIRARNTIASFLGIQEKWAEIKPLDISGFTADTNAIIEQMRTVAGEMAKSAKDRGKVIQNQVLGWKKVLDGVAPSLKEMGQESIETGNKIDKGLIKGTGFLEDAFKAVKQQLGFVSESVTGTGNVVAGQLTPAVDENTQSLLDNLKSLGDQAGALDTQTNPSVIGVMNSFKNQSNSIRENSTAIIQNSATSVMSMKKTAGQVELATRVWQTHATIAVAGLGNVNQSLIIVTRGVNAYISALRRIPEEIITHIKRYETTYIRRVFLLGWPFGLQKGGIVTKPTFALLGERGRKEAVIPLEKFKGMRPTEIYFSPTINISAEIASEIDIRMVADRLSEMWREDMRRMVGGLRA